MGKAFVPSGKPCCIFSDGKISASLSPKNLFILVQLPDSFKDFAIPYTGGKGLIKVLMTHCHREIFHAQWENLLNEEFLAAYKHGILIRCYDGVVRRLYQRIFTYSADYPEK